MQQVGSAEGDSKTCLASHRASQQRTQWCSSLSRAGGARLGRTGVPKPTGLDLVVQLGLGGSVVQQRNNQPDPTTRATSMVVGPA